MPALSAAIAHTRRVAAPRPLLLPSILFVAATAACNDHSTPAGQGNDVVDDTRDSEARPPANPDPGDGSIVTGEPDASYAEAGADAPSSVPGIAACDTCTCASTAGYCFGGATTRLPLVTPEARDAGDAGGDGGLPACPILTATPAAIGCNALPAGCTDCACLAAALQPAYSCYLVCAFNGTQMTVYCPNP
jgi:hypothetical protein